MENEKNSLNGVSGTWTDSQRRLLFKLMQENDLQTQDMEESLNFPMSDLSVREASQLIDCLKNKGNLSDVIEQIKEKRDNKSEPSNLNIPKSPEEAQIIRSRKSEFQVEPGSELALAKTAGIPEEMANLFFMKLNGTAYIKVAGLQFMAGEYTGYGSTTYEELPDAVVEGEQ